MRNVEWTKVGIDPVITSSGILFYLLEAMKKEDIRTHTHALARSPSHVSQVSLLEI